MLLPMLFAILTPYVLALSTYYFHTVTFDPYPGLPGLPHPDLDSLCRGLGGKVLLLPWDCDGYIRCVKDRAFWIGCPLDSRSLGRMTRPPVCLDKSACRAKEGDRWQQFCRQMKSGRYPSTQNCAVYYDCSLPLTDIRQHCEYPNLFHSTSGSCRDFRQTEASCLGRTVPKAPCEYDQGRDACSGPFCLPCEERRPSCVGMSDGFQSIPNRLQSRYYLKCDRHRTVEILQCPDEMVFSKNCNGCSPPGSTKCLTPAITKV